MPLPQLISAFHVSGGCMPGPQPRLEHHLWYGMWRSRNSYHQLYDILISVRIFDSLEVNLTVDGRMPY